MIENRNWIMAAKVCSTWVHFGLKRPTENLTDKRQNKRQKLVRLSFKLQQKPVQPAVDWFRYVHMQPLIFGTQAARFCSYLRCLAYFPLTWPLPSQPGVGQLRRKHTHTGGQIAHKLHSRVV